MRETFSLCFVLALILPLMADEKRKSPVAPNVVRVGNPAPRDAPTKEVEVSAKKYEYTPEIIQVPVNTLIRVHLTATDRDHGFELTSIKDSCVKFKPGEPATLEFYADKAGTYEFKCCKVCGIHHGRMKGKLVVK